IAAFAREASKTAAAFEDLGTKASASRDSVQAGSEALGFAAQQANDLGLPLSKVASSFVEFDGAASRAGLTATESQTLYNQFSRAIADSGATAEQTTTAMSALADGLRSGEVSASTLDTVFKNISPSLAQAALDTDNVAGKLASMGTKARLTSDQV